MHAPCTQHSVKFCPHLAGGCQLASTVHCDLHPPQVQRRTRAHGVVGHLHVHLTPLEAQLGTRAQGGHCCTLGRARQQLAAFSAPSLWIPNLEKMQVRRGSAKMYLPQHFCNYRTFDAWPQWLS